MAAFKKPHQHVGLIPSKRTPNSKHELTVAVTSNELRCCFSLVNSKQSGVYAVVLAV